ncbi:MAG: glycogen/starch/alpha-glucan phosphorylase, partial [bacterium]|nr:glycogen/starch/alpha-glucan phosphorylase [bacterium]
VASRKVRVIFLPNYWASQAEKVDSCGRPFRADPHRRLPEASGTGNMKMSLNGALTIGMLDGANIEIMKRSGGEDLHLRPDDRRGEPDAPTATTRAPGVTATGNCIACWT